MFLWKKRKHRNGRKFGKIKSELSSRRHCHYQPCRFLCLRNNKPHEASATLEDSGTKIQPPSTADNLIAARDKLDEESGKALPKNHVG